MNKQEFLDFLKQAGSTIQSLPIYPFKREWAKITDEISPHFYGDIPDALEKTFPNEDDEVFQYRKDTYQAKTKACITDAINKLSRLLQDSKFSVK